MEKNFYKKFLGKNPPIYGWVTLSDGLIFISMKIIITENRIKYLINDTLGYDLSQTIKMITDWEGAPSICRLMFPGKKNFNSLLNNWGPMYWVSTPDNGKWLVQQRENREWFIYKDYYNDHYGQRIDEYDLLSYMGINMFGIPLGTIIDNFVDEY